MPDVRFCGIQRYPLYIYQRHHTTLALVMMVGLVVVVKFGSRSYHVKPRVLLCFLSLMLLIMVT